MHEVFEFLKACGTFYLATNENDQPRVRPFGAVCEFEGRLYIVTNNQKPVFRQMTKNPKIEICGMHEGRWIRISGDAIHDPRREARLAMMDANASLSSMYHADDQLMEVFYLENATASIYSFTDAPKVVTL